MPKLLLAPGLADSRFAVPALLFLQPPAECSPGYYLASASCMPCGKGGFCTGADTARQSCGEHLTTKSATAPGVDACITLPGVAYAAGPAAAAPCPLNTYNAGGNRRNCTGEYEKSPEALAEILWRSAGCRILLQGLMIWLAVRLCSS